MLHILLYNSTETTACHNSSGFVYDGSTSQDNILDNMVGTIPAGIHSILNSSIPLVSNKNDVNGKNMHHYSITVEKRIVNAYGLNEGKKPY